MKGVFFLSIIIFFVIGVTSCIVIVWESIQAYIRGEYDPNTYIFRLRQGYEWKLTMMLANIGIILPMAFTLFHIINYIYIYIYILIIFGILLLTISVLNIKCYKKIRKKRILIYTIINDLLFIIFIIFMSSMLFK
jgi:hypothetical protein